MTTQQWQREILAILDSMPATFGAPELCTCGCGKPLQAIFAQVRQLATTSVVTAADRQRHADIQGLLPFKTGAEADRLTSEKAGLEAKFRAGAENAERERRATFAAGQTSSGGKVSDAEVQRLLGLSVVGHSHLWREKLAKLRSEPTR